LFDGEKSIDKRKANYTTLVNHYYDIVTDFYEYGWGKSFHFALRYQGEAFQQSIARHEHYLALRLGLRPGMKVLDVGCGVGGPLMEIARFSGASVTGINNNDYQIMRGTKYVEKHHLQDIASFIKGDFLHMPVPDNSYDAVYSIEATCHAPSKVAIYSEIYRVLKPGGYFAAYEWCLTDNFDPNNPEHQEIKRNIEIGDGLPDIDTTRVTYEALIKSGFEIVDEKDFDEVDPRNPVPWWQPLYPSFSLEGFRLTAVGRATTSFLVNTLEFLGILPKGITKAHDVLQTAVKGLVAGGQTKIFTPMYFFIVRKPETKSSSNGGIKSPRSRRKVQQ